MKNPDVVLWRTSNDGKAEEYSAATATVNDEPSMTFQDGKDDADINVIVRRFGIGAEMPAPRALPEFGDFSHVVDYQEALHQVMRAEEAFMELPADVRSRFGNDPGQLWLFVHDPANLEEARSLGIVEKAPVDPGPMKVEVVNPPAAPAATA